MQLYLPRDCSQVQDLTAQEEATPEPHGTGETILLVDDNEGIRRVARKQLTEFVLLVLVELAPLLLEILLLQQPAGSCLANLDRVAAQGADQDRGPSGPRCDSVGVLDSPSSAIVSSATAQAMFVPPRSMLT